MKGAFKQMLHLILAGDMTYMKTIHTVLAEHALCKAHTCTHMKECCVESCSLV